MVCRPVVADRIALMRSRLRIKVETWIRIRIRIKVMWIRNPTSEHEACILREILRLILLFGYLHCVSSSCQWLEIFHLNFLLLLCLLFLLAG